MATRFYLPSTGVADVSPVFTFQASWSQTTNADRLKCVTSRINSAMTSKTQAGINTAGSRILVRQYISDPISAQTISAGTVKGTIRVLESAANDNVDQVICKICVISNDGSSLTGTILNLGSYGPTAEFNTSLRAKRIADGDATTQVVANANDRILIELGYANTATGTSVSADMNFGDNSATDLGDNETDTAANNPFLELSQTITFAPILGQPRLLRQGDILGMNIGGLKNGRGW
jgi:hypothetical protein